MRLQKGPAFLPIFLTIVLIRFLIGSGYVVYRTMINEQASSMPEAPPSEWTDWPAYGKRFDRLKQQVAPRGAVGFITLAPPERIYHHPIAGAEYRFTQYALAPLLVLNRYDTEYVIGNFGVNGAIPKQLPAHLVLVEDYMNGLALFRSRR